MTRKRIATNLRRLRRVAALQHSCHADSTCKLPMQPSGITRNLGNVRGERQGCVLLQRVGKAKKLLRANHL
jgi:hypothetical protein